MKKTILTILSLLSMLFSNAFANTITEPIRTFHWHTNVILSVVFSPNGQYVLFSSYDDINCQQQEIYHA